MKKLKQMWIEPNLLKDINILKIERNHKTQSDLIRELIRKEKESKKKNEPIFPRWK